MASGAGPDPDDGAASPARGGRRWVRLLLGAAVLVVAAVRLRECLEPPVNTGDLSRHLLYGLLVRERGLAWAGVPLAAIDPGYAGVSWAGLPYNYPVLALLFFAAVAAVSPTLLAAKLALTAVEAANAALVGRLAGSRWLGLAYWAYPSSIWWVSREGQFEPLQNLPALAALAILPRAPAVAAALLGLAVQTKLTAVLLLPLVLAAAYRRGGRALLGAAAAFAASMAPTLVSLVYYPSVELLARYSAPLRFNPYHWDLRDPSIFFWCPPWLVAANAAASWALLAVLAAALVRAREGRLAYLAPLAFAAVLKVHVNVQFWYWLVVPVFVLPIPDRRLRRALLLLMPLADLYSAAQLAAGPFGYLAGASGGPGPPP